MRVFWLKIIVVCIFTFQLECQVKICCLTSDTSDIVNGLFRKKSKWVGGGVIEGQGYEIFKGTDEKRMRKFQRGSFKKIARKINVEFL